MLKEEVQLRRLATHHGLGARPKGLQHRVVNGASEADNAVAREGLPQRSGVMIN